MNALFLSMMLLQPPVVIEDGPPQVPDAPPSVPVAVVPVVKPPVEPTVDANALLRRAIATESFLVWVDGVPLEDLPDWQGQHVSDVRITGPWYKGSHSTYATLQTPTRQQVQTAMLTARSQWAAEVAERAERSVSRTARPKVWPLPSAAHDDDPEAGPLPDGFTLPDGMVRYKRASRTQAIAVTDGRDTIRPVPRLNLPDARWHQSGGMLGVTGWRSDLYRLLPEKPRVYVDNIQVWNGSNFQSNRGWKIDFALGSKFFDVLSNDDGKVFEVRSREKTSERWRNQVLFIDESARPNGYKGLNVSCVSCHNTVDGPGTGGYAVGLVPGGDTVFSVGLTALEPVERTELSDSREPERTIDEDFTDNALPAARRFRFFR